MERATTPSVENLADGAFIPSPTNPELASDNDKSQNSTPPTTAESPATIDGGPPQTEADTVDSTGIDDSATPTALLDANAIGLPADWEVTDFGPDSPSNDPLALGALPCPVEPSANVGWSRRRFSTSEAPLDSGLVEVELLAEVQSDEDFSNRVAELKDCAPGEFTTITTVQRVVDEPNGTESVVFTIAAAPSAAIAFPSRHALVMDHVDNRTVTVVFSGIDYGSDFEADASQVADRLIAQTG